MIIRIFLASLLSLLMGGTSAAGLPVVRGEWALAPKAAEAPQLRLPAGQAATRSTLPAVTEAEIAWVRASNQLAGTRNLQRRLVVGITRPRAPLPQASNLAWKAVAGGFAARAAVTSPEAGSMRLSIDLMGVPEDVEMVFFGADGARLEGPVKVGQVANRFVAWWSPLTEGATQTVEIFVPARHDPAAIGLRITGASHLFTTPSSGFTKRLIDIGDAGSCNVDVVCSPLNNSAAFRQASAASAQMVYTEPGFTGLCSGTLLADSDPATQKPWFYSANHCLDNSSPPYKTPEQMQTVANTVSTLWNFQANACVVGQGSGVPESTWRQVFGGAQMAYNNTSNDALLIRLNNAPPAEAFFSGWDANPISSNTSVTAIHFPWGDLKRVSQGVSLGFDVPTFNGTTSTYIKVRWATGTTEDGSSGGGLFTVNNGQYLLRGSLTGGFASCQAPTEVDYFTRLDQIYPSLAPFIGPLSVPQVDYTDMWWNPNESGWGLSLTQHPSNVIFGLWNTYEADGTSTWYVLPAGTWTNSFTYTGDLYIASGPSAAGVFNPALVSTRRVGSATLTFSSSSTGTFAFSVDGVTATKNIQRLSF